MKKQSGNWPGTVRNGFFTAHHVVPVAVTVSSDSRAGCRERPAFGGAPDLLGYLIPYDDRDGCGH